jgi:hypothetical protein
MAGEQQDGGLIEAVDEPLFSVQLGANGGTFAPTTVQEMHEWVQQELSFWSWASTVNAGHKSLLEAALKPLRQAATVANVCINGDASNNSDSALRERVNKVQSFVQQAFESHKLPHSKGVLGKRIEAMRVEDPRSAIAYLYVMLAPSQGNSHEFDSKDISSWRGFMQAIADRFALISPNDVEVQAQREALQEIYARAETLFGEKKAVVEQLHRDYVKTAGDISDTNTKQREDFDALVTASKEVLDKALEAHEREMGTLRRTFRESMTLRGPVEYWNSRAAVHEGKSKELMKVVFGAMAMLALVLGCIATWVFFTLTDGKPDAWKVSVLVFVGVLGVWALRLVVRMFLSHMHLATDAAERVTMVMTYLALLEGEKMPSDEDRKLVLQPLFRPATDGIVKDEGLPHPLLEMFTRMGQK